MNNGLKLLLMAAGAIVTCIVVVVGFQLTKSGKSDTNKASEQYIAMMNDYDEVKLTTYEGATASGSDVIHFIKDNANILTNKEIEKIIVETKAKGKQNYESTKSYTTNSSDVKQTATTYTDTTTIKTILETYQKHSTEEYYINPTGKFSCSIDRNNNGMIQNITFIQK